MCPLTIVAFWFTILSMLNENAKSKLFGYNLSIYRKLKGLSQEQLAELVEKSRDHIAKVETGKRNVSMPLLYKISDVLSVPEYEFFIFK